MNQHLQSKRLFSTGPFTLVLFLILFVLFPGVFTTSATFALRDFPAFGLPLAEYLGWSLRHGEIPLWNPFSQCGLPFAAQWNTMVFYPLLWPVALTSPSALLSLFCVCHLALGGVGMHRLARELTGSNPAGAVAGFAYAFNGLMLNSLMWPNNIAALGWFPWLVMTARQAQHGDLRKILIAGSIGGLQMLTGAPEVILFSWVVAGAVCLIDERASPPGTLQRIRRLIVIAALTTGIAMIQLLPFFELLSQSERWQSTASSDWSLGSTAWLRWVAPGFDTYPTPAGPVYQAEQAWTHSTYAGLLPLLLAVAGLRGSKRALAVALFVLILLAQMAAQGRKEGVFGMLGSWLPMRFPVKLLLFHTFCFPLLTALGISTLTSKRVPGSQLKALIPGATVVILLMIATTAAIGHLPGDRQAAAEHSLATRASLLFAFLVVLPIAQIRSATTDRSTALVALCALLFLALDLGTHQKSLAPTIKRQESSHVPPSLLPVEPDNTVPTNRTTSTAKARYQTLYAVSPSLNERWQLNQAGQGANFNLFHPTPNTGGFYSLNPGAINLLEGAMYAGSNGLHTGLLDLLGVSHVITHTNRFAWVPNPNPGSMIHLGAEPVAFPPDLILDALRYPGYSPREKAIVSNEIAGLLNVQKSSECGFDQLKITPHHIQFQTRANTRVLATISALWYPCWRATVDGEETTVWRVNHSFMAIEIPPGQHHIELVYEDSLFEIGRSLSLSTVLAMALLAGRLRHKRTMK